MIIPQYLVGQDVFVREPQRFVRNCTCIVGPIVSAFHGQRGWVYYVAAQICRLGPQALQELTLAFREVDIGLRTGTPLSMLSGRPGHAGFDEFCRIARSYGYD